MLKVIWQRGRYHVVGKSQKVVLCQKKIIHQPVLEYFLNQCRRKDLLLSPGKIATKLYNKKDLTVTWLDLANAYSTIPHSLILEALQ